MSEVIKIENAVFGYRGKPVLSINDLSIRKGDFLGIVGANGSGKSTLIKTIIGLLKPLGGKIRKERAARFGYVMQRQLLDTSYPVTVKDIILMGRYGRVGILRRIQKEDYKKVDEAIHLAGISGLENKRCSEISGGQLQRVLIARTLVSEPDVLFLDEPTNDLDIKGESEILGLIKGIWKKLGITVVMVSHDLHAVLNSSDKIVFLIDGTAHIRMTAEILNDEALSSIYSHPISLLQKNGKFACIGIGD